MEQTKTALKDKQRRKQLMHELLPFLALMFTLVFFMIVTDGALLSARNIKTIINQAFTVMIIALGAQFIMAHGALDLSIGGNLGVSMMVGSLVLRGTASIPLTILAIFVAAVGLEFINGGISSYLGLPAFLTSLCMMFILRGVLQYQNSVEIIKISGSYGFYDDTVFKIVAIIIVLLATLYLFRYNKLGKNLKIIGGNEKTAYILGIPVPRYKLYAYLITGVCIAIAAFFAMCRERYISADSGMGTEFRVMVALIFGGMPVSGGARARFVNAVIGSIIYTVLSIGMILWGLNTGMVDMVRGLLFLVVVYLGYKKTKGPLPR